MLTALEHPDLLIKAIGPGAVGYLSKPVSAGDVLAMVDRWCRSSGPNVPIVD